jgi:hypothetical protein
MKEWIRKIRWYFVSVGVVWLVMVFWVWPAFNQGGQMFHWSSCIVPTENGTYYMNQTYPPGCLDYVTIDINQCAVWVANESAVSDVDFGDNIWFPQMNWMSSTNESIWVRFAIGTFNQSGFNESFNKTEVAQGTPGEFGWLLTNMSSGGNFSVPEDDSLAVEVCVNRTVDIATNGSHLGGPFSDPPYPGLRLLPSVIPTLTQWGILIMAILIGLFSVWVLKRRVEIGG